MPYYNGKWVANKCPFTYRSELLEVLNEMYPGHTKSYWKTKKMPQLYAMWYNYKPTKKGDSHEHQNTLQHRHDTQAL